MNTTQSKIEKKEPLINEHDFSDFLEIPTSNIDNSRFKEGIVVFEKMYNGIPYEFAFSDGFRYLEITFKCEEGHDYLIDAGNITNINFVTRNSLKYITFDYSTPDINQLIIFIGNDISFKNAWYTTQIFEME